MTKFYVYTLAYPETMGGKVFYVGKGCDNRINAHEYEARNGKQSPKCDIIREIWTHGEQVLKKKIREHLTSKQAYLAEREIMHFYGLTTLANERRLGGTGKAYLCLPKTLSLSVTFREQLSHIIEECMAVENIPLSPDTCKEYLRRVCEQSLFDHLLAVIEEN